MLKYLTIINTCLFISFGTAWVFHARNMHSAIVRVEEWHAETNSKFFHQSEQYNVVISQLIKENNELRMVHFSMMPSPKGPEKNVR